jgi:Xaa-Pro dipeptidase
MEPFFMDRDEQRIDRNQQALKAAGLDALVCALPMNVLLLSGYWPVVGTSIAIFTSDGGVAVLVPEDEKELAAHGWAHDLKTFTPASLTQLVTLRKAVSYPLREIVTSLGLENACLGFELGPVIEAASYAAMNLYAARIDELLQHIAPGATLLPATELLTDMRKVLTQHEIACVKRSCSIAAAAFDEGRAGLRRTGIAETEAANAFRSRLTDPVEQFNSVERCDGFTYCMSGENSYEAFAAFQRSRPRQLREGDLVLIHCNSYTDGFWTDITRTYCLGEPEERKLEMYQAVFAARRAALGEIRPGVAAKWVDAAARDILARHGFDKEFLHGLGHAVGFHAIDHDAQPRLHPASPDVLEEGMVFNIEPAIYIEKFGGMRHCDMIAVTRNGYEILTPFHTSLSELSIPVSNNVAINAAA